MSERLPSVIDLAPMNDSAPFEDRLHQPTLYEGVLLRRCVAFFLDWIVLCCLFVLGHLATCATSVFTLGTLTPLAVVILGMLPIIRDPFWKPLAFTVIGGLIVAAVLTLIFLPALYVLWFRVPPQAKDEPAPASTEQPELAPAGP